MGTNRRGIRTCVAVVAVSVGAMAVMATPTAATGTTAKNGGAASAKDSLSLAPPKTGERTYIIRFKDSVNDTTATTEITKRNGTLARRLSRVFNGAVVNMTRAQLEILKTNPDVLWAEENKDVTRQTAVSPTGSWGLDRLDQRALPLNASYSYGTNGNGVDVYVVDTGVALTHNEFAGRLRAGVDVLGGDTTDCHGHGTHVAGTIAGATLGVAPGATVVPVRVLDCNGAGTVAGVVVGIDWAINDHATRPAVMNLSLGGGQSVTLDSAITRARGDGIVVVGAAGNSTVDACTTSPGSATADALIVGASTISDARASFSNFGACIDLFAPGENIVSAGIGSNTATVASSGTSMAAPHVSGLVARLLSATPATSVGDVMSQIVNAATVGAVSNAGPQSPTRLAYADPAVLATPAPTTAPPTSSTSPSTGGGDTTTTNPPSPGTGTPDTTTPGTDTPDANNPGTVSPEPDTPGDTPATPTVPERTGLPVAVPGAGSVWLEWTEAPASTLPVTAHIVRVYSAKRLVKTVRVGPASAHLVTGLSSKATYYFTVANENGAGVGEFSPRSNRVTPLRAVKISAKRLPTTRRQSPPTRPANVRAVRSGSSVTITWRAAGPEGALRYEILMSRSGITVARVVTTAPVGVRLFGLPKTKLRIQVRAINEYGAGVLSRPMVSPT